MLYMSDIRFKQFATKLKIIRLSKNISQNKLSALAGIDNSYIGKIEKGDKSPSFKTILKLADALDVQIRDLFDF